MSDKIIDVYMKRTREMLEKRMTENEIAKALGISPQQTAEVINTIRLQKQGREAIRKAIVHNKHTGKPIKVRKKTNAGAGGILLSINKIKSMGFDVEPGDYVTATLNEEENIVIKKQTD